MTRLIFIRHGQTMWNDLGRYQGHTDIPLNKTGIEQAQKVAKRLGKEKVSAIYASDLLRAKQTAEIIGLEFNLPVTLSENLREINFGVWEGKTYKEIELQYPELLNIWLSDPTKLQIPNGETFSQLQTRAWASISDIINMNKNKTVVVVSHGGTISTIICQILNINLKNLWQIKLNNSAVSIVDFYDQNKGVITLLNDTYHLQIS